MLLRLTVHLERVTRDTAAPRERRARADRLETESVDLPIAPPLNGPPRPRDHAQPAVEIRAQLRFGVLKGKLGVSGRIPLLGRFRLGLGDVDKVTRYLGRLAAPGIKSEAQLRREDAAFPADPTQRVSIDDISPARSDGE